ncbi:MAG: cytochrome C oxidase subunit II [Myxococcota bacterium]
MTIQATATLISFAGIALMVGIFLFVLARSGDEAAYDTVQPRAYSLRKQLFFILLAGFFIVPALTLRHLPYSPDGVESTVVDVTAHQWRWEISQTDFTAGESVLFRVGSADVNHGFAIYDDTNRVLAQVQAMPGYVNEIAFKFDDPGTYRIMCLEYCGLVHHGMLAALSVTDARETL